MIGERIAHGIVCTLSSIFLSNWNKVRIWILWQNFCDSIFVSLYKGTRGNAVDRCNWRHFCITSSFYWQANVRFGVVSVIILKYKCINLVSCCFLPTGIKKSLLNFGHRRNGHSDFRWFCCKFLITNFITVPKWVPRILPGLSFLWDHSVILNG